MSRKNRRPPLITHQVRRLGRAVAHSRSTTPIEGWVDAEGTYERCAVCGSEAVYEADGRVLRGRPLDVTEHRHT